MNTTESIDTNKKVAFFYDRCAVKQPQSSSDERMKRCSDFAKTQGYAIERTFFDNGVSGDSLHRPSFDALLEKLEAERCAGPIMVVIDDAARLARDTRVLVELRSAIQNAGGFLEIRDSSADERFMIDMCGVLHEYASEKGG